VKILSIGNFTTGWDGSICDEEHIAKALEELGHEVVRWQREEAKIVAFSFQDPLVDFEADFVLIAQWDGYPKDLLPMIKETAMKPKVVYFAFDYQEDGQEWHERLVQEADLYLSKPFKDYKHPNWQWFPQDFAPDFLNRQMIAVPQDIDVLFTGSWVPWESGKKRVEVLKAIDKKFNLHIYGVTPDQWKAEGFKNVHGPVMDHDLPALIARAKINFSMDHVHSTGYWSDRNAQIMACGGFVLFRHVSPAELIFGNGVAYFHTTDECLKKIEYYLKRPKERDRIAAQGNAQAIMGLKVKHRAFELIQVVQEIL
jgi:hypothetical protein